MTTGIRRAAVLGAGVMGSRIAAHLANAGIPTHLLDIVPRELTDAEKKAGLTLDSRIWQHERALCTASGLPMLFRPRPPYAQVVPGF